MTPPAALFAAGVAVSATGMESFRTADIRAKVAPSAALHHLWLAFAVASRVDGSWLFARFAPAYPEAAPKGPATKRTVTVEVEDYACDYGDMRENHCLALVGLREDREDAVVASFDSAHEASAFSNALSGQERAALAAALRTGNRLGMFQALAGGRYLTHAKPGRLIDLSTSEDMGPVRLCKAGEPWPMKPVTVDLRRAWGAARAGR